MIPFLSKYTSWIHTGFPASQNEKPPKTNEWGELKKNAGAYAVGPLNNGFTEKDSARSGALAVEKILEQNASPSEKENIRLAIIGAGTSGIEAAKEAQKAKLDFLLFEKNKNKENHKKHNLEVQNLEATHLRKQAQGFQVFFSDGTSKDVSHVIIATGKRSRKASNTFFKKSRIPRVGDWTWFSYASLAFSMIFCFFLYNWKSDNKVLPFYQIFQDRDWFPFNFDLLFNSLGKSFATAASTQGHILQTLVHSMGSPSFYYTLAYSLIVVIFGIRRIRKRNTQYVTVQTLTLMAFQLLPLFLLPEILLPWAGNNGWFLNGTTGGQIADLFFESYDNLGMNRAYWRSYGLILAWPLFIWNVFTSQPMWAWLVISLIQTFVLIPWLVWKWGKGSYCGWICSCGALAETLGDEHRHKMPHGKFWNRLNMLGQIILGVAFFLFILRTITWVFPNTGLERIFWFVLSDLPIFHYSWFVDLFLSGILGVGLYFWFSGRTWCRFACPLAALMHIYARFSRYRIFTNKEKCISCHSCTQTCHQGIHVMSFAQRGLPMNDPECVRCSSCIQVCPTEVLSFGELNPKTNEIKFDRLSARSK